MDARRVQAVCGLVEQQQVRVSQQRGGEAEPLAHPERIRPHRPGPGVLELDKAEELVDPVIADAAGQPERLQVIAPGAAGVEVVGLEHGSDSASRAIELPVGAAEDPAGKSGLGHLVEHMTFELLPKGAGGPSLENLLTVVALEYNAYTSEDETHYYVEGLAQKLERAIMNGKFTLDHDLAAQHHAHWTEANIQDFWAGASFYLPDERNRLSYSLSAILTEFLATDWNAFLEVVLCAGSRDAGQDAALKVLNRCLGETAGRFLGPGHWRPQRKAIAERRKKKPTEGHCLHSGL